MFIIIIIIIIIIIFIVTIRDSHIAYNYMENQSYSSRRYYVHYNT